MQLGGLFKRIREHPMASQIIRATFAILGASTLLGGCSDGDFAGNAGRASRTEATAIGKDTKGGTDGPNDVNQPSAKLGQPSSEIKITGDDLSEDDQAINACLDKWGTLPFSASQVRNYQTLKAAVQVFGSGGIVHQKPDTGPQLFLVKAGVSVLSQTVHKFLTPNTYYCMDVAINAVTNVEVHLTCNAYLADTKVSVDVLSGADQMAGVGVNVLSNVKVVRPPGC